MKTSRQIIIRILVVAIPLLLLYFYSEMAIEENRKREHRTDVGLGIAILFGFTMFVLLVGFFIDFVSRIVKKQYQMVFIDSIFLIILLIPGGYIASKFFG